MSGDPPWIVEIKQTHPRAFKDMGEFMFACDEGWRDLIQWALGKMVTADPNLRGLQIKEKHGTLRIYARTNSPVAKQARQDAEELSACICEKCGRPGSLDTSRPGWLTLCPPCAELRWVRESPELPDDNYRSPLTTTTTPHRG